MKKARPITKRCITCGKTKPLAAFNSHPQTKDKRSSSCRKCSNGYDRKYLENPQNAQRGRDRANRHYLDNRAQKIKQVSKYQFDRKMKAVNFLGGKCARCPETHPATLQFHHRDPSEKVFMLSSKTLSTPNKFPWAVIETELAKCELLCSNCHSKLHSKWNQWIGVE